MDECDEQYLIEMSRDDNFIVWWFDNYQNVWLQVDEICSRRDEPGPVAYLLGTNGQYVALYGCERFEFIITTTSVAQWPSDKKVRPHVGRI